MPSVSASSASPCILSAPFVPLQPAHEKTFFGDNFVRTSGEYAAWQALNLHSMTAAEKGGTVHVQVRVGQGRAWSCAVHRPTMCARLAAAAPRDHQRYQGLLC